MNGDEVRDVTFLRANGGYDASQVDDLLRRLAVELDAGRPAGPLIANARFGRSGFRVRSRAYDMQAVSWFLDQLRRREDPSQPAGANADPWRDLPVENRFTRRGPGDLADHVAAPSRRARRKQMSQDLKDITRECADAWRDFGQQPGLNLRQVSAGILRCELRTAEQQTIASLRYGRRTTVSTGGMTFTRKRVPRSSRPEIAETVRRSRREAFPHFLAQSTRQAKIVDDNVPQLREIVDETGTPILYTSGRHLSCQAGACITFPDQRWLRFPVRGTGFGSEGKKTAIMTAVDQAGNKIARYRIIGKVRTIVPEPIWRPTVEITVHPGQPLTDELVLAIAVSATWLVAYFHPAEGGGG